MVMLDRIIHSLQCFFGSLYGFTLRKYVGTRRHNAAKDYLEGDILDLGCGGDILLQFINDESRYVGVDIQDTLLETLKKTHPWCKFYCINLCERGKLRDTIQSKFDTITALAVIEHLEDPSVMLAQCHDLLKVGGKLVITCPTPRGEKFLQLANTITGMSKESTRPHLHVYSKHELIDLLKAAELIPVVYRKFFFGLNQLIVGSARS